MISWYLVFITNTCDITVILTQINTSLPSSASYSLLVASSHHLSIYGRCQAFSVAGTTLSNSLWDRLWNPSISFHLKTFLLPNCRRISCTRDSTTVFSTCQFHTQFTASVLRKCNAFMRKYVTSKTVTTYSQPASGLGSIPVAFFHLSDELVSRELSLNNKDELFDSILSTVDIQQTSNDHR